MGSAVSKLSCRNSPDPTLTYSLCVATGSALDPPTNCRRSFPAQALHAEFAGGPGHGGLAARLGGGLCMIFLVRDWGRGRAAAGALGLPGCDAGPARRPGAGALAPAGTRVRFDRP
jgi:hypothetical protein